MRVPDRVRSPDTFYFCEAALSAIRSYDVSLTTTNKPLLEACGFNRVVEDLGDVNSMSETGIKMGRPNDFGRFSELDREGTCCHAEMGPIYARY